MRPAKLFEISINIPKAHEKTLCELHMVRNVLVHNAGIIDEKAVEAFHDKNLKPGEEFEINETKLLRYYDAASSFVLELLEQTTKSPFLRSLPTETT